jgi:hypothetical protein
MLAALAACRADLWRAPQATAATALDGLIGGETALDSKKIHTHLKTIFNEEETTLFEIRITLILAALPRVFESYGDINGKPTPTTFNRHATAHSLSPAQLTPSNAIVGMLLTTSLLRELHEHGGDEISVRDVLVRAELIEDSGDSPS